MTDIMQYLPQMQQISHEIMDEVLRERENFRYKFSPSEIKQILDKDKLEKIDLMGLLSDAALEFTEQIAQKARSVTRANFGNSIQLFTPLYISNFCENLCVYCGFGCNNNIKRTFLNDREIQNELKIIAQSKLSEILILTGESEKFSNVKYIANAANLARSYFSTIGVEVYPLNCDDYTLLHENGVDFVTIFNETYSLKKYSQIHLKGNKRIFPYRFNSQERAILGGMRGVGFGALLGLDDYKKDTFSTALHAKLIQQKYPHANIALSVPRLRPTSTNANIKARSVDERRLLQVICAYRLFLPFASITISTRESAKFRNGVVQIAANKISAGVSVGIGTHSKNKGEVQFEIDDKRSVFKMREDLLNLGLQPVFKDYDFV